MNGKLNQLTSNLNLLTGELTKQRRRTENATAVIRDLEVEAAAAKNAAAEMHLRVARLGSEFDVVKANATATIQRFSRLDRGLETRFDDLDVLMDSLKRDLIQKVDDLVQEAIVATSN